MSDQIFIEDSTKPHQVELNNSNHRFEYGKALCDE